MKKLFLCFLLGSGTFSMAPIHAQSTAGTERVFSNKEYDEMIDNYDGFLRNHKNTDGLLVDAGLVSGILEGYKGQQVAIMYARYPKDFIANNKKHRTTLLLAVYGPDKKVATYIDLGSKGRLCPLPVDCNPLLLQ